MPVIVRMTTHVCHAKEKVAFDGWYPQAPDDTPRFDAANGPYIPIAAEAVFPMKRRALARLGPGRALGRPEGLVPAGEPRQSAAGGDHRRAALSVAPRCGSGGRRPARHPQTRCGAPAAQGPDRGILSKPTGRSRFSKNSTTCSSSRSRPWPSTTRSTAPSPERPRPKTWIGEYTPDRVDTLLRRLWPEMLPRRPAAVAGAAPPTPGRPAQMCPGCGHRSAFHAIRQALAADDITVADIGCHTLGFLPPYRVG